MNPVHSDPHQAEPKGGEFKYSEFDNMLAMSVVETFQKACASPVVILQKKDGALRFCLEHRKLETVKIRDLNL